MRVDGYDITRWDFRRGPVSITYTLAFEQQLARVAAGLSFEDYDALPGTPEWVNPAQPVWSKCHVIMWYRLSQRVPAVANDAQTRDMERRRSFSGLGHG